MPAAVILPHRAIRWFLMSFVDEHIYPKKEVMCCKNISVIYCFENHCFEGCVHIVMIVVYAMDFSVFVSELRELCCILL